MSQDIVVISVIVVFIVLVVILINKNTSDTPSDSGQDASTQEPSGSTPSNVDDPFKSAVSAEASEESPASADSAPDVEEDAPNPFKAPS